MKITGKVLFASEETAATFLAELTKFTKENDAIQSSSWDETRLFKYMMPNRTHVHKSEKNGIKHGKTDELWFLCANAAGHLVKPVHRVKNPRALKSKTRNYLPYLAIESESVGFSYIVSGTVPSIHQKKKKVRTVK